MVTETKKKNCRERDKGIVTVGVSKACNCGKEKDWLGKVTTELIICEYRLEGREGASQCE